LLYVNILIWQNPIIWIFIFIYLIAEIELNNAIFAQNEN